MDIRVLKSMFFLLFQLKPLEQLCISDGRQYLWKLKNGCPTVNGTYDVLLILLELPDFIVVILIANPPLPLFSKNFVLDHHLDQVSDSFGQCVEAVFIQLDVSSLKKLPGWIVEKKWLKEICSPCFKISVCYDEKWELDLIEPRSYPVIPLKILLISAERSSQSSYCSLTLNSSDMTTKVSFIFLSMPLNKSSVLRNQIMLNILN